MDIAYPRTWVPYEILKASDLNQQFEAVASVVNGNLNNGNIVANAGILGSKLATFPNGISNPQLNDLCVSKRNLQPGAVDGSIIANNTINTDQLVDGAVTTDKLRDYSVTKAKIYGASTIRAANQAVKTTAEFQNGATALNDYLRASINALTAFGKMYLSVMGAITPPNTGKAVTIRVRIRLNQGPGGPFLYEIERVVQSPTGTGAVQTTWTVALTCFVGLNPNAMNSIGVDIYQVSQNPVTQVIQAGALLLEEPS